ncbi:MAG: hypothetical protein HZB39_06390 [Planctomycetes bacterium]|nr:hypothetical protein [Planctomycetota bacterium]
MSNPTGALRRAVLALAVPAVLCAASLDAQTIRIVDSRGGTGYTDIQPAIAASAPGDIVIVRPGVYIYSPITITRGIQVLADPGVFLTVFSGTFPTMIAIRNLPAGETVVVRGLQARGFRAPCAEIIACQGLVQLEDLTLAGPLIVRNSTVSMTRVAVDGGAAPTAGGPGLTLDGSEAIATACTFRGGFTLGPGPGVECRNGSRLVLAECTAVGVNSALGPEPGIAVAGGRLTLTGTAASSIAASSGGAPAITVSSNPQNRVVIDPGTNLVPSGGLPPVSGPAQFLPIGGLTAAVSGGVLSATLTAPHATLAMLVASAPDRPAPWLEPIDPWIGVHNIVLDVGAIGPGGVRTISLTLPSLPIGTFVALQSFVLEPAGIALSTPLILRVD